MLAEYGFGDLIWTMFALFFWFMLIWMFIDVFADIFRRDDLSGGAKAGWILLIFILPLFGILIYVIARPTMTEQDREMAMSAPAASRPVLEAHFGLPRGSARSLLGREAYIWSGRRSRHDQWPGRGSPDIIRSG